MSWGDYHRLRQGVGIETTRKVVVHAAGVLQVLLLVALLWVAWMTIAVVVTEPREPVVTLTGASGLTLGRLPLTTPLDADTPTAEGVARDRALRVASQGMLAILLAVGLVLLLALAILEIARRLVISRLAARFASALRRQIHRQMYRFGQSALPNEGMGPIVDLFTQDVDDIRDGFRASLADWWRLLAAMILLPAFAFVVGGWLTIFLLVLGVLVAWLVGSMLRRSALSADLAERNASMTMTLLNEDLGQIRTVRVYSIEAVDNRRFDRHLEDYREADATRMRLDRRVGPGTMLLLGIAGAVALGMTGSVVIAGGLAPPAALLMLLLLGLSAWALSGWLRMARIRLRASRAASSIVSFLDRRPEILQVPSAKFLSPVRERIVLENVSVEGPTGRRLLDGVSLELPAGSKTAIMGRDEDSKQALVCMIPRLLDPKSGRVRMDGLDLREVTLESLRAQVSTVFQSDLIFSDTVAFNLGLGDLSYDLPRLIEAAKQAHAHHIIQDLPEGYDTFVGPLGHFLRVDEQYRIALARTWLHDPSILIIEEPTVPFDDSIKPLIDDAIFRLSHGRTVLFLAHRLSTIRACDRVVVLHNGRIEATGTAKDLQAHSKLYRHLQYVEFNQFAAGGIEVGQMQD